MGDLAYWEGGWIVEATDYEVRVGSSAADLPLSGIFRVE